MEKNNYMISILGEQTLDGETDRVEVITEGNFMKKKDRFFIGYKEYDDQDPNEHFDNLIKVEGDTVTATAKLVSRGRKLHVWDVHINDSLGDLISTVHVTNYIISPKNEEGESQWNED